MCCQKLVLGWVSYGCPRPVGWDEVCEGVNPPPVSGTLGLQRGGPPGEGRGLLWDGTGVLSGAGGLPSPPATVRLGRRQQRWKRTLRDGTGCLVVLPLGHGDLGLSRAVWQLFVDSKSCNVSLKTSFHGNASAVLKLIFPPPKKPNP